MGDQLGSSDDGERKREARDERKREERHESRAEADRCQQVSADEPKPFSAILAAAGLWVTDVLKRDEAEGESKAEKIGDGNPGNGDREEQASGGEEGFEQVDSEEFQFGHESLRGDGGKRGRAAGFCRLGEEIVEGGRKHRGRDRKRNGTYEDENEADEQEHAGRCPALRAQPKIFELNGDHVLGPALSGLKAEGVEPESEGNRKRGPTEKHGGGYEDSQSPEGHGCAVNK